MNDGKGCSCAQRATETDVTFVFQWRIAEGCIFPLPLASLASTRLSLGSRRYLDGIGKLRSITFIRLPLRRLFMSCLLQVHLLARNMRKVPRRRTHARATKSLLSKFMGAPLEECTFRYDAYITSCEIEVGFLSSVLQ